METIPTTQFLAWARALGVVPDPRYAPPECLVHESLAGECRWWKLPRQGAGVERLLSHLLSGVGPWSACHLWRRGGHWPSLAPPHNRIEAARRMAAMGPAIPDGFEGAVRYARGELDLMIGRITAHAASGWCVRDDLFVLPDDGRHIVQTDHHGAVHVSCLGVLDMGRLIEHMSAGGYPLPTEPLDWTFKRP